MTGFDRHAARIVNRFDRHAARTTDAARA